MRCGVRCAGCKTKLQRMFNRLDIVGSENFAIVTGQQNIRAIAPNSETARIEGVKFPPISRLDDLPTCRTAQISASQKPKSFKALCNSLR